MKWLKIAGIVAIISVALQYMTPLLAIIAPSILTKARFIVYIPLFFAIIFSFFGYLGFVYLGKYANNKFLVIVSWITFIAVLATTILSFASLVVPSILPLINTYLFKSLLNPLAIFQLILGFALLRVKGVSLTKITGVFLILSGIISVFSLYIFSSLFFGSSPLGIFPYLFAGIITFATSVLEIIMFFKASKQFESIQSSS